MSTNGAPENGVSRANPFVDLVRRIEDGDQRAIDLLWRRAKQRLTAYLSRRFGKIPRPVVDEDVLASDVFLELYRQIGDGGLKPVATDAHFWAIATTIAERRFTDQRRSQACKKYGGDVRFVRLSTLDCAPADANVADAGFELEEELLETIYRLQDSWVWAIYILIVGHYTRRETADALHISRDIVDRRLQMLREGLRARAEGKNCDLATRPKHFSRVDPKSMPRYTDSGGGVLPNGRRPRRDRAIEKPEKLPRDSADPAHIRQGGRHLTCATNDDFRRDPGRQVMIGFVPATKGKTKSPRVSPGRGDIF